MRSTVRAVADELASAAELVLGKTAARPVGDRPGSGVHPRRGLDPRPRDAAPRTTSSAETVPRPEPDDFGASAPVSGIWAMPLRSEAVVERGTADYASVRSGQHRSRAEPGRGHGIGCAPRRRVGRVRRQGLRPWPADAAPGDHRPARSAWSSSRVFMALAALDVGGQVVLWENAHWTAAGGARGRVRRARRSEERGHGPPDRLLVALGTLAWFIGQCAGYVQTALGFFSVPAPSDVGFLLVAPPIIVAFVVAVYGRLPRPRRSRSTSTPIAIFLAITAIILAIYGDRVGAGASPVAPSRSPTRSCTSPPPRPAWSPCSPLAPSPRGGGYLLLVGFAILGFAWVDWLRQAVVALPAAGSLGQLRLLDRDRRRRARRAQLAARRRPRDAVPPVSAVVLGGLPLVALLASALILAVRPRRDAATRPGRAVLPFAVILLAGVRQTFLVHERGRLLDDSRDARDELEIALIQRAEADSRYQTPRRARSRRGLHRRRATPSVTDGGQLAYMSPQIEVDPRLPARGVPRRSGALAAAHPSGRPGRDARRATPSTGRPEQPLRARLPDDRAPTARSSGSTTRPTRCATSPTGGRRGLAGPARRHHRTEAARGAAPPRRLPRSADRAGQPCPVPRAPRPGARRSTPAPGRASPCCSSTSTTSRSSTTRSATAPATASWSRSPSGSRATIRADDIAARQGGDEFTILLERVHGEDEAVALAERLAARSAPPIELEGRPLVDRREHRDRPRARPTTRGRRPAGPRRCRDVRGQGAGQGPPRRLRPVDAAARPEPPRDGGRAPRRDRGRGSSSSTTSRSSSCRSHGSSGSRRSSAGATPSAASSRRASSSRSPRRPGSIVPLGRLVTDDGVPAAPRAWRDAGDRPADAHDERQRLAAPGRRTGFAAEVARHPRRDRARPVGPRPRDHRVADAPRVATARRRAAAAARPGRPPRDRRLRDRVLARSSTSSGSPCRA